MRDPLPNSSCARCGSTPASWLVAISYDGPQAQRGPGRLLPRCGSCADEDLALPGLSLLMPLSVVAARPDAVMMALYESGATESAPETVADMLGLPGIWVEAARGFVDAKHAGQRG